MKEGNVFFQIKLLLVCFLIEVVVCSNFTPEQNFLDTYAHFRYKPWKWKAPRNNRSLERFVYDPPRIFHEFDWVFDFSFSKKSGTNPKLVFINAYYLQN